MTVERLSTTDGFVVHDLEDAPTALGVVRSAPKVLVDGARWLARSQTYQAAVLERRVGGASAGLNATAEGLGVALEAFVAEVAPSVGTGRLLLLPGRGIPPGALVGLRAVDAGHDALWDHRAELVARGVVAAAEAALGPGASLDGRTVSVESLDDVGVAVALAAAERGARLAALGGPAGAAAVPADVGADALAEGLREHGAGVVAALGLEVRAPALALAAEVDVLVVGSKPGVVDHLVAEQVTAGVVVPSGPIPITARGLAVLSRQGAVVLPDFVTTAGTTLAALPPRGVDGTDAEALGDGVEATVAALVAEVVGAEGGPFLAACQRAEGYLATWQGELPFGRPLA